MMMACRCVSRAHTVRLYGSTVLKNVHSAVLVISVQDAQMSTQHFGKRMLDVHTYNTSVKEHAYN